MMESVEERPIGEVRIDQTVAARIGKTAQQVQDVWMLVPVTHNPIVYSTDSMTQIKKVVLRARVDTYI